MFASLAFRVPVLKNNPWRSRLLCLGDIEAGSIHIFRITEKSLIEVHEVLTPHEAVTREKVERPTKCPQSGMKWGRVAVPTHCLGKCLTHHSKPLSKVELTARDRSSLYMTAVYIVTSYLHEGYPNRRHQCPEPLATRRTDASPFPVPI